MLKSYGAPVSTFDDIIGLRNIKKQAMMLARFDVDILLLGETGVGKGMFASAIHQMSCRKIHNFVHLDCATIPPTLFETELFGYKKGSFTDAKEDRKGKLSIAHKGTFFLDEIGEIPTECQAKILRAVEHGFFYPVGANQPREIDVRFLCATNKDLQRSIGDGKFRQDLFYRINAHTISIPPLRRMKKEVVKLINHFWSEWTKTTNIMQKPISEEEARIISSHHYPGNARELRGLLGRIFINSINLNGLERMEYIEQEMNNVRGTSQFMCLEEKIDEYIKEVVQKTKSIAEAMRILKVDRKTILKRIDK